MNNIKEHWIGQILPDFVDVGVEKREDFVKHIAERCSDVISKTLDDSTNSDGKVL